MGATKNMLLFSCILTFELGAAQGILIGEAGAPDENAAVEVRSMDNGLLVPRMTSAQRAAIGAPANGLIVFDTSEGSLFIFSGGSWLELEPYPQGSIMMWSGSLAGIPAGWALCDGTSGTPDLSGRFIVGYNPGETDYDSPGKTGGAASVALSESEIPAHNHSVDDNHSHPSSSIADGHNHDFNASITKLSTGGFIAGTLKGQTFSTEPANKKTDEETVPATIAPNTTGVTLQNAGGGSAHENRPKFYVLAFIMKL